VVRGHVLTDDDARRKRLIMDLMCNLRLSWEEIGDERGTITERLAAYVRDGLVILDEVGLRVTDAGRYLLRNVAMEFDAYLRRASGDGPRYSRTV
jgi:oxygen-independent coproporphyrinogen-3 oxidase